MSDPMFTEPEKATSHDHEWDVIHWQREREREKPGGMGRPQFQVDTEGTDDDVC